MPGKPPPMKPSGRKSAASLSVVPVVELPRRPDPPADLSAEEQAVWREACDGMSARWYGSEMMPLLRCYCTQVVLADRWRRALIGLDVEDKRFAALCGMHRESSRTVAALAGRLRLTPRSHREAPKDLRERRGPRPWEEQAEPA